MVSKLANLYASLETVKVDIYDLAPLLKKLRPQQRKLQDNRDSLLVKMNKETGRVADLEALRWYVADMKELLGSASFLDRRAFLRSFIERVELTPTQGSY